MAKSKGSGPLNMGSDQRLETILKIAKDMVVAKKQADAARDPIRTLKGSLKAVGVGADIFNLVFGIWALEDDEQRQARLDQLFLCAKALLGAEVAQELFSRDEVVSQPPAKAAALAAVTEQPKVDEPEPVVADGAAPFESDPEDGIGAPEAAWDEGIIDADDPALDSAGTVFNAGRDAGRAGATPEENPHEDGSAEHTLWERGRAKGAAEPAQPAEQPAVDPVPVQAVPFDVALKFTGTTEEKRIRAYWHGWNGTRAGLASDALLEGRRGEILKQIKLGIADFNGGLEPRFANLDRSVRFTAKGTGTTAPSTDGVHVLETAVLDGIAEVFRHTNASFVYAAVQALEAADLREVLTYERIMVIVRSCCPEGFGFVFAVDYPPVTAAAVAPMEELNAATDHPDAGAGSDDDPFGLNEPPAPIPTDGQSDGDEEARVEVQKVGDKLVIIDLKDRQPLIDAPSGYTAAAWVRAIHQHFAGRLETVTGAELKDTLKQLALGKPLAPAEADAEADVLFAAAV